MLIGDNRACAAALNELLKGPEPETRMMIGGGRQKQVVRRAFLFGHYDSRGGASLVVADEIGEAVRKYAAAFGMVGELAEDASEEDRREQAETLHQMFAEDYMAWVEVYVCDGELPDGDAELDDDYAEGGFRYGRIEEKYKDSSAGKWQKTNKLVLWKGPKPKLAVEDDRFMRFRLEREELGEDAFGLCLFH